MAGRGGKFEKYLRKRKLQREAWSDPAYHTPNAGTAGTNPALRSDASGGGLSSSGTPAKRRARFVPKRDT